MTLQKRVQTTGPKTSNFASLVGQEESPPFQWPSCDNVERHPELSQNLSESVNCIILTTDYSTERYSEAKAKSTTIQIGIEMAVQFFPLSL